MPSIAQSELDRVMRRGRRIFQPAFTLCYLPTRLPVKPRIVVSQKVDKRSVVRHKVKRQIRHILRTLPPTAHGLVILVRPAILQNSFAQISGQLRKALSSL